MRRATVAAAAAALAASAPLVAAGPTAPGATAANQAQFNQSIATAKAAMLGDPARARVLGHAARRAAETWPPSASREVAIATAQWIEGEGAYRANDIAAAAPLTNNALAVAEKVAPGSKLNADLLLSRARLQREAGRPQNALADLQSAYNMFARRHDPRGEAKTLQSIGSIYQDAQDYERVLYYYKQAEELADNDSLSLSAFNNMANAYTHLGRTREANQAYKRALQLARKLQSPVLVANVLENIGDLATENHDYAAADAAITAGLKLTAGTAAGWRPLLLGARAKLEFAEGRLDDARRDLAAAFATVDDTTADQAFSGVHLTAYRVYKATGDEARALEHLEAYRQLDEQARTLAASTNASLMTARFDFANQNARIATLKTGQLSRDIALAKLRARQSAVIFSSLLALLAVLLVFLFVYLRSVRRNRNEVMRANERLAQSNVELEDALQAKSQFLATTSHEIRTPLNGILGMTQVILADRSVGGVVRDRIGLVDAAGRAMRTLVDDILDFAKMDSGAVRLDAAPVDLGVLMPDLVSLWRVQAQDKGIALRLALSGIDAPLLTDAARLRQIVSNLLSNAVKFTAAGAVTVDVRAEAGPDGPMVVIAVADTGIGVPPTAFETIFEPFRQLDTSTTRQFGGTGLGLAISRHLARVLGGDITVAAPATGGSCFTLRLPYPPVAAAAAPAPAPVVDILVAGTNPIRRSFLRTALEAEFGRAAACDAVDLPAFLAANTVGVVLFDVGDDDDRAMPDRILAALAASATPVPLILLVPAALAGHCAAWTAAGAVRVVAKPLRVDALAAILRAERGGKVIDLPQVVTQAVVLAADMP